jgi:hypothetical protein
VWSTQSLYIQLPSLWLVPLLALRVYSRIHDIAANVNFEEEDGWE